MRWQAILETISNDITGIGNPLPPDNVGNEQWRIHHDKQHWMGGGWTDKFPRQMLQKWASMPRLLSGIVAFLIARFIHYYDNNCEVRYFNKAFYFVITVVWKSESRQPSVGWRSRVQVAERLHADLWHHGGTSQEQVLRKATLRSYDGFSVSREEVVSSRRAYGWHLAGEHGNPLGFYKSTEFD